jgi:hypothetical protein
MPVNGYDFFKVFFFECYRKFHKSFCFEFLSFEFEDLF